MTSDTTSSSAQANDGAEPTGIPDAQSARVPPIPPATSDFLASFMKTHMETLQLLVKVSQDNSKISQENSALLTIENARLRQELADLRNLRSTTDYATVVDDFSTFTYFPQLPPEIRTKIWKYSARHPRVVEVRKEEMRDEIEDDDNYDEDRKLYTVFNNTPPAVLQANQESRRATLQYYQLGSLNNMQFPTYFNLEADIIYLAYEFQIYDSEGDYGTWTDPLDSMGWFGKNIHRVAIRMSCIQDPKDLLRQFAPLGVREIMLVDETAVCDPNKFMMFNTDLLNMVENLELVKLSPLDMVRRQAFLAPSQEVPPQDSTSHIQYILTQDYQSPILSVAKLVELAGNGLRSEKAAILKGPNWEFHHPGVDTFDPLITIARLRFRDSECEGSKDSKGKGTIIITVSDFQRVLTRNKEKEKQREAQGKRKIFLL